MFFSSVVFGLATVIVAVFERRLSERRKLVTDEPRSEQASIFSSASKAASSKRNLANASASSA